MRRPTNHRLALYAIIVLFPLALATPLLADTIILKDGTRIQGTVLEENEGFVTFQLRDGRSTIRFEKSEAISIERKETVEPGLIDDVLLFPSISPRPQPPSQSPTATPSPSAVTRPVRVGVSTPAGPTAAREPAGPPPSEWFLPEALRNKGVAVAVIAGGLVLVTPALSLLLWGMAYLVRIEEPTLLRSFVVALAGVALFLIGFLVLHGLDVPLELDAYIFILVVVFVIAVAVARAVYAASLFQAFLLWGLPASIVAVIAFLLGGRL